MRKVVIAALKESIRIKQEILDRQVDEILQIAVLVERALKRGKKILLCGNGGSAADSQHIAAELIGRFQKERKSFAAIALTTNTSNLTALGNDYGYESVFARQVEGLGQKGDVLIAISTSGNSPNVIRAVQQAKKGGLKTVSLTGCKGGKLARLTDLSFIAPSNNTARIQEAHISMAHAVCELVEKNLS